MTPTVGPVLPRVVISVVGCGTWPSSGIRQNRPTPGCCCTILTPTAMKPETGTQLLGLGLILLMVGIVFATLAAIRLSGSACRR
jgi:hypothetical protein